MYFVEPTSNCIIPLASCTYSPVNQRKAMLPNDVGFATVYRRIYCCKFITLSNQTSHCICKCIRNYDNTYKKLSLTFITAVKHFGVNVGDNCIQNFNLRRYIVRYTIGNLVLRKTRELSLKTWLPTVYPTIYFPK